MGTCSGEFSEIEWVQVVELVVCWNGDREQNSNLIKWRLAVMKWMQGVEIMLLYCDEMRSGAGDGGDGGAALWEYGHGRRRPCRCPVRGWIRSRGSALP